jgi:SPP1 gp7 family putative phage head morphogenesis protein
MILNYFEPAINFNMAPEQAIAYFSGKGLKPTYSYLDMIGEQHDRAFTVAKMMDLDLLKTVQDKLQLALQNGESLQSFKKNLQPILEDAGWWGKKGILNPDGSTTTIQLGSSSRLDTIYRTNMQSAYAAGRWKDITETADTFPYLMYDAVDDGITRIDHAAMDNKVFPINHPFWTYAYPPNGYNCRCGVIQMDSDIMEQYGLKLGGDVPPLKFVDFNFQSNAGIGFDDILKEVQAAKIAKMTASEASAATKGIKANDAKAKKLKPAQTQLDEIKLTAAKDAQAQAVKNAQTQLTEIGEGNSPKQAGIKKQLYEKALIDGITDPIKTLDEIIEQAAAIQAKKELASLMSQYKKKILEGKLPTNKQQSVFDNLDEASKAKITQDITKKQAAVVAAKPKLDPTAPLYELNMLNMKKIGEQAGSNPGGLYYDNDTGIKWYIKRPPSDDHARNEVLAAKLYESGGIEVPNVQLITDMDGNLRVASQIVDGLEKDATKLASGNIANVKEGFVFDAWLANWDVVGLSFDNMLIKQNRAIRIDTGGALLYRAQGGLKGNDFTGVVNEIDDLRNAKINKQSAKIFKNITAKDLDAGVRKLELLDGATIDKLVAQYGPKSPIEKIKLSKLLNERRAYLIDRLKIEVADTIQLARAKELVEAQVKSQIAAVDNQLIDTLKGINSAFKTEGIRPKDIERFNEFKSMLNQLMASGKLSQKTQRQLSGHYDNWINEIQNSIDNKVGLNGNFYSGYTGKIDVSKDAVDQLALTFGDLPPTTPEQATSIIKNYLGESASSMTVPKNGKLEYQDAYAKLTDGHKRSISLYTGSHYDELNTSLYTQNATAKQIAYRDLLNEAIEYSDDYNGLSTRGLDLRGKGNATQLWIEGHQRALKTGEPVKYISFISSTMGDTAAFGGNIKISINGKYGTWVNPISLNAQGRENEVLLGANSVFTVMDVVDRGNGNWTIVLNQIEAVQTKPELEFNEHG